MEGTQCSQSGCNCHDFLPFECLLCEEVYCLEHRSRFNHSCVLFDSNPNKEEAEDVPTPEEGFSVKSMFAAVANRFMTTEPASSPKEHHRVQSSSVPANQKTSAKFNNKVNGLDNVAKNANSLKQKSIGDKTRQILIKSKALGNSEVAGADRLYLIVHFVTSPNAKVGNSASSDSGASYFYFNRNLTIAEMINALRKQYPQLVHSVYPSNVNKDTLTLAIINEDSPDWKSWNRNSVLKDTFLNFEEITLFPHDLNEVVSNQSKLQARGRVITMNNPIIVKKEEDEKAKKVKKDFAKGDVVWYHKSSNVPPATASEEAITSEEVSSSATPSTDMEVTSEGGSSSSSATPTPAAVSPEQEEMLLVTVIGVHHDDFPNVYYTIQPVRPIQFINGRNNNTELTMNVFEEKQTDSTHLKHLEPGVDSRIDEMLQNKTRATLENLGEPIPIRVSYGESNYHNVKIGNMATIQQLKQLIRIVIGVPLPDMKLICKGTVLKNDTQLIKSSKIVNGSKIIVMSSGGAK